MSALDRMKELNNKATLEQLVEGMCSDEKMRPHFDKIVSYLLLETSNYLEGSEKIDDEEDHDYYTAVQYIELKARWIQMNLRLSYQAFSAGEGDPYVLLKAAATSYLLGEIENFVSKKYLSEIQRLLAQPVFGANSDAA